MYTNVCVFIIICTHADTVAIYSCIFSLFFLSKLNYCITTYFFFVLFIYLLIFVRTDVQMHALWNRVGEVGGGGGGRGGAIRQRHLAIIFLFFFWFTQLTCLVLKKIQNGQRGKGMSETCMFSLLYLIAVSKMLTFDTANIVAKSSCHQPDSLCYAWQLSVDQYFCLWLIH